MKLQELVDQCLLCCNYNCLLLCKNSIGSWSLCSILHTGIYNDNPISTLKAVKMFEETSINWIRQFLTSSPSKVYNTKVLFSRIFDTMKGRNNRLSNLPCFPFYSFLASHLKTISPFEKVFSLIFLSNLSLIFILYN